MPISFTTSTPYVSTSTSSGTTIRLDPSTWGTTNTTTTSRRVAEHNFEVGDRVKINSMSPDDTFAVGDSNVGTVIGINEWDDYCLINWDNAGPNTYCNDREYPNQWNVPFQSLIKINEPFIEHANYKVIRKVKQMYKKRKDKGYAF